MHTQLENNDPDIRGKQRHGKPDYYLQTLGKIMLKFLRQRLTGSVTSFLSKLVVKRIYIYVMKKKQPCKVLDNTVRPKITKKAYVNTMLALFRQRLRRSFR